MIDGIGNHLTLGRIAGSAPAPAKSAEGVGASSFADVLKQQIDDFSRLQLDASKAAQELSAGRTENVAGLMTAIDKADVAFQTLLEIRAKLMDAYDEIKNMSV